MLAIYWSCDKKSENKIHVIAESVVIRKDQDTYKWIIESIAEMELFVVSIQDSYYFLRWVNIPNSLHSLNIADSCTLRCYYWHLMHEVFPKEHIFERVFFLQN